jgi:SAM-dependent methyltransferase
VACERCGVAATDPWPTDAELEAAYSGFYRPAGGRFGGPGDALLRRSRAVLARRVDRLAPPGPVLDVGSGEGVLVDALQARGRDARGLERGDPQVTELDGEWAAVVLWHSLEHLREPGAALEAAARLLAPGGLLVVAVPNAASLQAQAFGSRWFALDLPRHLTHIPAGALRRRVEELGLRVRRVSYWRGGQVLFGWLHGLSGGRLYDAIRRPAARSRPMGGAARAATLAAAVLAAPLAVVAAAAEAALHRGGTVYLEAVR